MKQVIVVRNDLKLPKGKLSVQVAHASVMNVLELLKTRKGKRIVKSWVDDGQKKVVVKVQSIEELRSLYNKARRLGIVTNMVKDAGLTVLKPGTITCLAIGPEKDEVIDKITQNLKLL